MTVAFSEHERAHIRERLIEAAQDCMKRTGIRKTTVEELADSAGISKGAFYLFYENKELLFLDALEAYQQSILTALIARVQTSGRPSPAQLGDLLFDLFLDVKNSFIPNILERKEYDYLLRKMPEEFMAHHQGVDDVFTEQLFAVLGVRSCSEPALVSAAFRAVFLTMLHQKEIGEEQFDAVFRILINALANEFFEEEPV